MKRLRHYFEHLDELLGSLALVVMTLVVAVGFVLRYALGQPLYWGNEVAGILFIWVIFLGASVGVRHNSHLGVDLLVNLAPRRLRLWLELLVDAAVAIVLIALLVLGWELTDHSIKKTIALEAPYWIINSAVPIGALLMLIHLGVRTVKRFRGQLPASGQPCGQNESQTTLNEV